MLLSVRGKIQASVINRLRFPTCSVNPLKKQRFGDFPNTKPSLAPTRKATSKTT